MTATLINIAPVQATLDPAAAGLPGASPVGPADGPPRGDPRAFAAAMQALRNPHGERVSAPATGSDLAVTGVRPTAAARLAELYLPPAAGAAAEPPIEPLSIVPESAVDAAEPLLLPTGNPLPETGNSLPLLAGQSDAGAAGDVPTPNPPADGAPASASAPPSALATGLVTAPPSALALETTPVPADAAELPSLAPADKGLIDKNLLRDSASADESAPELVSTEPVLDDEMTGPRPAQRAFEAALARTEPLPGARTAPVASFASGGGESALTGLSPVAGQAPGVLPALTDAAMDLPQFQAMRPLQPTVDPQGFVAGLGQRLTVMSGQGGVQSARLQLHPENLGTLDVTIRIEEDTARVWFNAQHGQTREILEAALPKLRDLFAQQGMALLEADVGSGDDRQRANQAFDSVDTPYRDGTADGETVAVAEQSAPVMVRWVSDRMLDVYA